MTAPSRPETLSTGICTCDPDVYCACLSGTCRCAPGCCECKMRAANPYLTPGPSALRNAMLEMCLALAAGLGTDWSKEACKARAMAGPVALVKAHDMQVRHK